MTNANGAVKRGKTGNRWVDRLEGALFGNRPLVLIAFALVSLGLALSATRLEIDAGFEKHLPSTHPFMQVFTEHQAEFGGANRLLVAVRARSGDIYTATFLETLRDVTDAVFFLPGVNKASVRSLFTPNVRFAEVVRGGFSGGNVVPPDYQGTDQDVRQVRTHVFKAGIVGRLVANDHSAAIVTAELVETDPRTGERLDYIETARLLETELRARYSSPEVDIHIIGFAKMVGEVAEHAGNALMFFAIAFALSLVPVYFFTRSAWYTGLLMLCSTVAVVWTLGFLSLFGFGIDPMSILVPFLVLAIGISHGVQVTGAAGTAVRSGAGSTGAARVAFRRLAIPGAVALASDCAGFLTMQIIDVQIIRDLATTMSIGVAAILFTNLMLLPVLMSYARHDDEYGRRLQAAIQASAPVCGRLSRLAAWPASAIMLVLALAAFGIGIQGAQNYAVGDVHEGVPELRSDSRYNRDSAAITRLFAVGVDVLTVIVETRPDACVDFTVLDRIDDFAARMAQIHGVQSTLSLPAVARKINAGFNEGHPKWQTLPRTTASLVQSTGPVETGSGLLNADCSVMPVLIFTTDHRAETIDRIVAAVTAYAKTHDSDTLSFRLATGNLGVMAATNDLVRDSELEMLIWIYAAVIALCLLAFRSIRATLCVVLPLALVSTLTFALMTLLEIGLKVSTLPVAALGVGIGVDYGIYIFSDMKRRLDGGAELVVAFRETLAVTGTAVLVTGMTLALGVITWIFSALKFQADMGLLLAFMFLANMAGAVLLAPALAWLFYTVPAHMGARLSKRP